MNGRTQAAWRIAGVGLLALAFVPLHRLLGPRAGPAGASTRAAADAAIASAWTGTGVVLAVSALIVALVEFRARALKGSLGTPSRTSHWERVTTRGLSAVSAPVWAMGCAVVAGGMAALVGRYLRGHRPMLIDEFVQLRHGRLLADGSIVEGWPIDMAFRNTANGFTAPEGWASIYPPGHTVLLAIAERLSILPLLGPILVACTAGLTAALLLRLLGERPTTARVAAAAAVLSPFSWGIGSGYLSHTSAACAVALALWAAVRAREGAWAWAVVTGIGAGWAVTSRPLIGLTLACALPAAYWSVALFERRPSPGLRLVDEAVPAEPRKGARFASRIAGAVLGGLPFAIGLAWWNHTTTGDIFGFGYLAAYGPAHGLGLGPDPWGNIYGMREALAYTGADVVALGTRLFETPIPAVAAVGLWILVRGRPFRGSGLLFAWGATAVATNAWYWHHGSHLGPRMLYEAAPAWAALTVLAAIGLGLPRGTLAPPTDGEEEPGHGGTSAEGLVALARVAAVLSVGWALSVGLPARLGSWALSPELTAPVPDAPALVFVHGSWAGREAARLEATGMRRDSVGTALRRNDLCRVHEYAAARRAGLPLPRLDLEALPGSPSFLATLEVSPGNLARVDPSTRLSIDCTREARSDQLGTLELAPVLASAPPFSNDARVIYVRDLGPAQNQAALLHFPGREAWVWMGDGGELAPYDAGMQRLWGTIRTERP